MSKKIITRDRWHYRLYSFFLWINRLKEPSSTSFCTYFWSCVAAVIGIPLFISVAIGMSLLNLVYGLPMILIGFKPTAKFWWFNYYIKSKRTVLIASDLSGFMILLSLIFCIGLGGIGIVIIAITNNYYYDAGLGWVFIFASFILHVRILPLIIADFFQPAQFWISLSEFVKQSVIEPVDRFFKVYIDSLGKKACSEVEFRDADTREREVTSL